MSEKCCNFARFLYIIQRKHFVTHKNKRILYGVGLLGALMLLLYTCRGGCAREEGNEWTMDNGQWTMDSVEPQNVDTVEPQAVESRVESQERNEWKMDNGEWTMDSVVPQNVDTIEPQPVDTVVPQPIDSVIPEIFDTIETKVDSIVPQPVDSVFERRVDAFERRVDSIEWKVENGEWKIDSVAEQPEDTIVPEYVDSGKVVVENVEPMPFMALRTNMLYDVALIPNIGVEFWLPMNFTIGADYFGTWLYSDKKHIYWQGYGGYLTLRYYFGRRAAEQRFVGHHVGIYGSVLTYDVEFGGKGYQAAKPGFGGGIEYGFSLPVHECLAIDFNIGVGYQGGEYKVYRPTYDGSGHYEWLSTHRRRWFGPTKAEISLKWMISAPKKKKGGQP